MNPFSSAEGVEKEASAGCPDNICAGRHKFAVNLTFLKIHVHFYNSFVTHKSLTYIQFKHPVDEGGAPPRRTGICCAIAVAWRISVQIAKML